MIPKGDRWSATGKRKTAIARVTLTPGSGQIFIHKWRLFPTDEAASISYRDPKSGAVIEEAVVFSPKAKTKPNAVPTTARLGKKPFQYTPIAEYFGRETLQMIVNQPFEITKTVGQYDVFVNVTGGGLSGQAGAIRHGIAKALVFLERTKATSAVVEASEGDNSRSPVRLSLKRAGLLTRDSRTKERKKYGRAAARKRFQFSKR